MLALILLAPLGLTLAGVEEQTARAAHEFLWGRAWNVTSMALFGAVRSYIQAEGATRAIVVATIIGNVVNFVGDALLIYGDRALVAIGLPAIGLPALGVLGAGLSSTIASIVMLGVVVAAARAVPAPTDPDGRKLDPEIIRHIVRLGGPIALQLVIEISAFGAAAVLSGRIGRTDAAANQIALQLASFTFMVPLGVATATAVRVGVAIGRQDTRGARRAGACGLAVSLAFMACAALLFIAAPLLIARVLTNKAQVLAAAAPLITIAAIFQLSDGTQVTAAGALRGAGDTHGTFIANLIGHFAVGVPLAVILAFPLGLGTPGLWWGLSVGLTVVALSLAWRFHRLTSREVRRVENA
jgi:MATE family multidrug resistance protein